MKQPVKASRPPILLDKVGRQDDINNKLSDKERLKQQVNNMVANSEEYKNNNRESICTNLLESGNVQSFIDLFYITHKCLPNVMEQKNYFGEKLHIPEYIYFNSDFLRKIRRLFNFTVILPHHFPKLKLNLTLKGPKNKQR